MTAVQEVEYNLIKTAKGDGRMEKVYKLTAATKDNLWGGNRLREYGKVSSSDRIAEAWELSFTEGGEAHLSDGRSTVCAFDRETWGDNCRSFEFFPVLTKFIDAREKLSVQVHPSDEYALKNEGQYGKTEMWYVVDADEGAGLYMGLKGPVSREDFLASVKDGSVEKYLSFTPVRAGDIFFIPAGTIHAIGEGTLIYEIQQNSTLTYRLYDYMRRDKDGNLRELHTERAMAVSVLDKYEGVPRDKNNPEIIGKCKYFEASKYQLNFTNKTFNVDKSSFISLTVISGEGSIDGTPVSRGDTVFCPAGAGEIEVCAQENMEFIAVRVP